MAVSESARRTQEERRNESDARIIAAAIELFASQGYRQTTLIQIGQAAGYTGTLISNRFGSKEKLLRAVLAHILDRFYPYTGNADAGRTGDAGMVPAADMQLLGFIEQYLMDVNDRQSRIRALHVIIGEALGGMPQVHDQIVKVNRAFRRHVEGYIVHGIETGAFRADLDPAEAAIIIVGLLRGVTMQALAEPRTIEITSMISPLQATVRAFVISNAPTGSDRL
ncbi:MAG: TetR/AcrR family transcriptional regulator [Minwuia sp.]|nr:TetR/AcrR family transcriptional regulator [Minwuia sp.]